MRRRVKYSNDFLPLSDRQTHFDRNQKLITSDNDRYRYQKVATSYRYPRILCFIPLVLIILQSFDVSPWQMRDLSLSTSTQRNECGCFYHNGKGAKIAYLITLHNERTLKESISLIKSIAVPSSIILVHIDKILPMKKYKESDLFHFIEGECRACDARFKVESIYRLKWGSWEMNLPTLWAMKELTENPMYSDHWNVFINLSADSLPVYTPQIISNMFGTKGPLHGYNFVTSSPCLTGLRPTNIQDDVPPYYFKKLHYEKEGDFLLTFTDEDGTERTEKIVIHVGSQWIALTPDAVTYIVKSLHRQDSLASRFRNEFVKRNMLMSDETFIPTILAHHPILKDSFPKDDLEITAIRYERMDEDKPSPYGDIATDQHYDSPNPHIEPSKAWGPYYLGIYDIGDIKRSGALFIRKISNDIDPNLTRIFPVAKKEAIPDIYWPNEVKVSKKVDVKKMMLDFYQMKKGYFIPKQTGK